MAGERAPLKVLVVSADTATLYDLSWMLSAVGYSVEVTKRCEPNAAWRRYADADFILLDGRSLEGPYEPAMAHESENPVYWILLYDPHRPTDFAAWYGAGGHDMLRVPVSRGELLTRVRAGARYLEFERRLKQQSSRSFLPGMLSNRGLLRTLRQLDAGPGSETSRHMFVVTAIDWYAGIRRQGGEIASRGLVSATARAIKHAAGEGAVAAYLGDGRFATLLVGQTRLYARRAVEQMVQEFASHVSHRDAIARPTLTTSVVPWRAGQTPQQLLDAGLTALELARQSGGDCFFEQAGFSKELAAWQSEMAAGNPFADVVAQDIMEPFSAILQSGVDQPAMVAALRRAEAPVCPYVDRDGRLVGVASAQSRVDDHVATWVNSLAALPISKPTTIPHDATFPEIYEAFSTQACGTLIVVADGRPLGYITCSGFLSLIEPIDSSTFASSCEPGDNSMDLIVALASSAPDSL